MPTELLSLSTPEEVAERLRERLRTLRLLAGLKRTSLSKRSGVSVSSLRRFETTGRISLGRLLRLAHALGRLAEFEALFAPPRARTLDELESRTERPIPKRGKR